MRNGHLCGRARAPTAIRPCRRRAATRSCQSQSQGRPRRPGQDKPDGKDKDRRPRNGQASGRQTRTSRPPQTHPRRFEGLSQRFVPIRWRSATTTILVVADGALFYLARKQPGSVLEPPGPDAWRRCGPVSLQLRGTRGEAAAVAPGRYLAPAPTAKSCCSPWARTSSKSADANEKLDSKPVDLSGVRMLVDPRQEWHQIFDEVWRMERAVLLRSQHARARLARRPRPLRAAAGSSCSAART